MFEIFVSENVKSHNLVELERFKFADVMHY